MFGLFKSVAKLTEDVVGIVVAPVEMAVDATRVITKPAADLVKGAAQDIKDSID